MKKTIFAIVLVTLLASCADNSEIKITGKVRNTEGLNIVYSKTVDGMHNSQLIDTLKIAADSTFSLTLPAGKLERIRFYLWGKSLLGSTFLKKGNIELDIDAAAEKPLIIKSVDEKELAVADLLSQLDNDVFSLRARQGDRWNIAEDTVATSVSQKLKDYALSLEKQMEGVNKDIYSKAKQDIHMQLLLAFQNQVFATSYRSSEETKKEWLAELDRMTEFCQIDHPDSPFSLAFYDVASNDAGVRYYMKEEKIPEGIEKGPELIFYHYEHQLTGNAQEAAMAQLILEDEAREQNNPLIPPLAERFHQLYPQSKWLPLVDKAVEKNRAFNLMEIPDYIHFPDVAKIKTFKDITDRYKGKVVFMDIWATWCGPCRSSFAHIKPLQEYAAQKEIVLLYLSIDRPEDDDKWRKMAAHYDLRGEHIRIQEEFKQEVYDTFGDKGSLSIPHYVIINKSGEIHFKVASSPENMDKLKEQLEESSK